MERRVQSCAAQPIVINQTLTYTVRTLDEGFQALHSCCLLCRKKLKRLKKIILRGTFWRHVIHKERVLYVHSLFSLIKIKHSVTKNYIVDFHIRQRCGRQWLVPTVCHSACEDMALDGAISNDLHKMN